MADIVKHAGYNYAEKYYEEHHKEHPDWIIYGSETSFTVQSRGVYKFPYEAEILCDDDEQCSCLGNCKTSWGAKNTEFILNGRLYGRYDIDHKHGKELVAHYKVP